MSFQFQRRYTGRLQAVILDWAGTTVDYGCCAPVAALVETLQRRGIELEHGEARSSLNMGKYDHLSALAQTPSVIQQWQAIYGAQSSDADLEAMFYELESTLVGVVVDYAELVPGVLELVQYCHGRSIHIGTTTGYSRQVMVQLVSATRAQGYEPDAIICVDDVLAGRPAPWMALQNAHYLQCYPMEALVKIGDTVADIEEGLNGGMWTIGVVASGNEVGLTLAEMEALTPQERATSLQAGYQRLYQAGAHYVVDTIADVLPLLEAIEARLRQGERP
ncbi:MAG: phosphonoacetaldehyde hydrolase [Chloroflexaceae bacterium]|nr:phosphonoacetaldehyde hydrolase [Chloroflexaceae bacterium]